MRTEGFTGILLSIFVIYLLLTSVALLILGWTFLTSASSEAQIWTEDAGGNIMTDFEPAETVYIRGSCFNLNAQIEITIRRPDTTVDQGSTLSDDNGNFVYAYLLNGIRGTYYVTATDGVNSACTTFDDTPKLQGFDKETGEWSSGSLSGWEELDWVPYRIGFKDLPEGYSSYIFNVYHNNLLDNEDGVDRLGDFRVGDEDGNPVTGSVIFSGPYYSTPGKGCDRDIYYALSVSFRAASPGLTWYVYWHAHLAFGASGWPGSSLHAYTDISGTRGGKQDVGINVPPDPTGSISGSEWNDLNRNGAWDLDELGLSCWTIQLYSFDSVENVWIHLVDENTDAAGVYTFSGLVNGNYYLAEILQDNWIQTHPSAGTHSVTLSGGENRSGLDFGNSLAVRHVVVSISPSYQSGLPGENLEYTVTVRNLGNVEDNYDFITHDTEGWGLSIDSPIMVPTFENRTTTLTVTMPYNATGCTHDNITVIATSQADNTTSDNDSCIAHVQVVRGVEVLIEPDSQPGVIGENVVFTVTVKNIGNVWDNYNLTPSDDAGWALTLDNDYLEIPENENRETKLIVAIPDNENLVCTTDNITVVATAVDNAEVTDNDNATVHAVPSWTGTAVFSLVNLYTVNVEKILDINQGSKLVVKFYTYDDAFENENVIETFSPHLHVEEIKSARHPEDLGVKKARLDLTTDDTGNVISTIASFTVRKVDLETRFMKIPGEWFFAPPADRTALELEFLAIPGKWFLAPS